MITVLLVDDQPTVRQAVRMLLALEPDLDIVGEAGDGAAALRLVSVLRPQVVVMDVEMPGMDGLSATTALATIAPESAVVILSLHDDEATRARLHNAGATAFIAKHQAGEALTATIRQAACQPPGMQV